MKKLLFLLAITAFSFISKAQTTATVEINSVETIKIGKITYDAVTFTIDATTAEIYGVGVSVLINGENNGGGGIYDPRSLSNREGTYTIYVGLLPKSVKRDRIYVINVWADAEWIHSAPYAVVTGN